MLNRSQVLSTHSDSRVCGMAVDMFRRVKRAGKTRTHCGGNIADVTACFPNVDSFCHARNICGRHEFCVLDAKKCFWKSSQTFLVSARRATMLPRFATDRQNRAGHNVATRTHEFLVYGCEALPTVKLFPWLRSSEWEKPLTLREMHKWGIEIW